MANIITNIARSIGRTMRGSGEREPSRARRGLPVSEIWSATGGTPSLSLAVSTVYRCAAVISQTIASLPLQVRVRRGGIYLPDTASPLSWLLGMEPNPYTTAFDLVQKAVQDILLHGNAYILPRRDSAGEVIALTLLTPGSVSYDASTDTYEVNDLYQGVSGTYADSDIIHLRNMTLDGKTGLSVLTFARLSVDTAARGDKEQEQRFATGGRTRGFLAYDKPGQSFAMDRISELVDLSEYVEKMVNVTGQGIVALPGDVKYIPNTMTSADMQFLEARKFGVLEICRFFGVHPSFVFQDTSNNYKSAESANAAFLTNTLNPILRKMELELTRKLIRTGRRGGRVIQFDRPALFALDLDTLHRHQKARLDMGTATINELRAELNRPAVDGGDAPLVSANLRTLAELSPETSDESDQSDESDESDPIKQLTDN